MNFRCLYPGLNRFDSLSGVQFRLEQQPERRFDVLDLPGCKTFSLQADRVHPKRLSVSFADCPGIGQDILRDNAVAADITVRPNAAELVHAGKSADCRVVLNGDMAGECRSIRQDDVIAKMAIVSNMHIHHQEVVISYYRLPPTALRSTVDVHVLAKDVVRTDRQEGVFALELEILRLESDGAEWKETVVLADGRRTFDDDVGVQPAATSDRHAISNPAVRPDEDVGTKPRFWTDKGSGVNHGC